MAVAAEVANDTDLVRDGVDVEAGEAGEGNESVISAGAGRATDGGGDPGGGIDPDDVTVGGGIADAASPVEEPVGGIEVDAEKKRVVGGEGDGTLVIKVPGVALSKLTRRGVPIR